MKINIDSRNKKILASIIAGIFGNVLALLSSLLNPLQPQATFDFSHIATFGTAIAFGPFYGLLAGAIGSLYPYYEFAIAGVYGPWWGLAICGLLRGKVPPFLAVNISYVPESIFTLGFLFLMTVVLPAGSMPPQTMSDILLEGWVEVIIFSFIIETVVRRRIMETSVLMLEIFIIMLLVHKQFIESLLILLLVTLITITLFEIIEPAIKKQYPKHPED
jgi:hypothetical protein